MQQTGLQPSPHGIAMVTQDLIEKNEFNSAYSMLKSLPSNYKVQTK